jgi:hypothetical protein
VDEGGVREIRFGVDATQSIEVAVADEHSSLGAVLPQFSGDRLVTVVQTQEKELAEENLGQVSPESPLEVRYRLLQLSAKSASIS